jgi:hypothetical protein
MSDASATALSAAGNGKYVVEQRGEVQIKVYNLFYLFLIFILFSGTRYNDHTLADETHGSGKVIGTYLFD